VGTEGRRLGWSNLQALSLEAYFGFMEGLEQLLACPVDLVEASAMRTRYLKASVERSREPVFTA
jgi:hypothetical protein